MRHLSRLLTGPLTRLLLVALLVATFTAAPGPDPNPGITRAIEVATNAQAQAALGALPGVVGFGVGVNGQGRGVIFVFTENAGVAGIPDQIDGVPVVPQVTGLVYAIHHREGHGGGPGGGGGGGDDEIDRTARFDRPVPIGVSTGHPAITAGTIGARVVNGDGALFALSNNHVYADGNAASIGDAVIQPGSYDGGSSPADNIGTLSAFKPIDFSGGDNVIDAAIAATTAGEVGNATPSDGYGTPSATTTAATINAKVKKYGRTTGQTNGFVWTTNTTINVCYNSDCSLVARFVDQVSFKGQGKGGFSAGGDSGSLIVTRSGANPMALLFAGNSVLTFGNPIDAVLGEFGVSIDGQ